MRKYQLPEYEIGPDLRDKPKDTLEYLEFLRGLEKDLQQELSVNDRLAALEIYAIGSRMVGQLNSAELSLKVALKICKRENYSDKIFQNTIRLAHVFQWKKNFEKSNDLFFECENMIGGELSKSLVASFWQHKGKNLFDQSFFELSAECFTKALEIRNSLGAPQEQVKSSQYALRIALAKIDEADQGSL